MWRCYINIVFLTILTSNFGNAKILKEGDICLSVAGNLGRCKMLDDCKLAKKDLLGNNIWPIRCNFNNKDVYCCEDGDIVTTTFEEGATVAATNVAGDESETAATAESSITSSKTSTATTAGMSNGAPILVTRTFPKETAVTAIPTTVTNATATSSRATKATAIPTTVKITTATPPRAKSATATPSTSTTTTVTFSTATTATPFITFPLLLTYFVLSALQ